jgi:hypothetical protein
MTTWFLFPGSINVWKMFDTQPVDDEDSNERGTVRKWYGLGFDPDSESDYVCRI